MTYNCDCDYCYYKNNYDCLREKWCQYERDSLAEEPCFCCSCKKRKPLCKGRFGLAWISESSKNQQCYCKPCGWQIEFEGTASKVDQSFKELTQWANNPPPPLFTKLNDNDNCCCLVRDLNEFLTEDNCCLCTQKAIHGKSDRRIKEDRLEEKLVKKECGCECYLLTGIKSDENSVDEMNAKKKGDGGTDKNLKTDQRKSKDNKKNDGNNVHHHHNHNYDNMTPLEKIRKAHAVRDEVLHSINEEEK